MKFLILLLVGYSAFAAECPNGTREVLKCTSTPAPEDSRLVSEMFDAISVCRNSAGPVQAYLAATVGPNTGYQKVEVTDRIGGSTFSATDNIGRKVSFSVPQGIAPNQPIIGQLKIEFTHAEGGLEGHSTYLCTRK